MTKQPMSEEFRICFHRNLTSIACCVYHGEGVPPCRQCADCGEWVTPERMDVFVAEEEEPVSSFETFYAPEGGHFDQVYELDRNLVVKVRYSSPYEAVAAKFHEAYERLAPDFGYKTREESAVPWEDVPQANKDLMCAVVKELMDNDDIMAKWMPPKTFITSAEREAHDRPEVPE